VTVYAETGELEVHAPITAATEINLETEDDRIDINAALTAADVTLTSMNGDILSSDTGTIDAATIEANTGGKVDLDGKLTASDWVDIEAVGSVTAADIESGDRDGQDDRHQCQHRHQPDRNLDRPGRQG